MANRDGWEPVLLNEHLHIQEPVLNEHLHIQEPVPMVPYKRGINMKTLKKINKGLILTILVLIVLILYFNNLEKQRDKDKPDIKKACEDFIELTDKYSVLPEELQKLQEDIPEEKVDEYINQMQKDLADIMIDNQESINIQQKILEENLKNGYSTLEVRTNSSRKIQKVSSYQFENNQVTVSLKDNVVETM